MHSSNVKIMSQIQKIKMQKKVIVAKGYYYLILLYIDVDGVMLHGELRSLM